MPDHELTDQAPPGSELTRRAVVAGTGILAVSAVLAAYSSYGNSASPAPPAQATPPAPPSAPQAAPPASAAPPAAPAPPAGEPLGNTGDIPVGGGAVFAGQKVVVTQPAPATFKAFSAVCTHQGCTVNKVVAGTIDCPCHGSKYAIADGSVVHGPAPRPLPKRQITVSGDMILLV